jgi:DhnA family fructose-bisphosphate aldolase class Ia
MKTLRIRRLFRDGKAIFAALDHGVTLGPIPGLTHIRQTVASLVDAKRLDALILHKGNLRLCRYIFQRDDRISTVLHLNGAEAFGPFAYNKEMLSTVEDALMLGADAVSVHVNLGNEHSPEMLRNLGRVASDCLRWGMPLLAMMVVQGDDPGCDLLQAKRTTVRIAMEAGADMVKIQHPGSLRDLRSIIDGVEIPVLVAGGLYTADDEAFLGAMHQAVEAGASGFAVGRNLFGRRNHQATATALHRILREGVDTGRALLCLREIAVLDNEFSRTLHSHLGIQIDESIQEV